MHTLTHLLSRILLQVVSAGAIFALVLFSGNVRVDFLRASVCAVCILRDCFAGIIEHEHVALRVCQSRPRARCALHHNGRQSAKVLQLYYDLPRASSLSTSAMPASAVARCSRLLAG